MFGLSTELITKGKLAPVSSFDNKAVTRCYYTVIQKTRTTNTVRSLFNSIQFNSFILPLTKNNDY